MEFERRKEIPFSSELSPNLYFTLGALRRVIQNGQMGVSGSILWWWLFIWIGANRTYYGLRLATASNKVLFSLPRSPLWALLREKERSNLKQWVLSLLVLSARLSGGQLGSTVVFWALCGFYSTKAWSIHTAFSQSHKPFFF